MLPRRSILRFLGVPIVSLCPAILTDVRAEETPSAMMQKAPTDCSRCHSCRLPTAGNLCLLSPCTRDRAGNPRITAPHGPDTIVLGQLESDYLPVPFDHKGHARMGQMSRGCATCHHNTPKGGTPSKCETCHDAHSAGTDIDKPGLRGAFHQQCLGCHRNWSSETDCEKCHLRKTGREVSLTSARTTVDDLLLRNHPPIHEPEGDFYGGDRTKDSEHRVIFRHAQHVNRFGLNCVDCHNEPNCSRCHADGGDHRPTLPVTHHAPCIRCHKNEMTLSARDTGGCERCHWTSGSSSPAPFDHAVTGWPLKQYHQERACRDCHREIPFERPSRECRACHSAWSTSNFEHAKTGLILDENHSSLSCESCHANQRFDQPPVCTECHNNVTYPALMPGRRG